MKELPTPETLATLVSRVTETMFGMSFQLAHRESQALPFQSEKPWRLALLPMAGARPLTVAIASDEPGAAALGSAMFSCRPAEVDAQMADDSLSELTNIVAGQVKTVLQLDQSLGLPRVTWMPSGDQGALGWHNATLNGGHQHVKVWVAIAEKLL